MVELDLPDHFSEEFMSLIPNHRMVVQSMLAKGMLKSYALSMDRSRIWAIFVAESEFDVLEMIARMPLGPYLTPTVSELMFFNSPDMVMHFSMN